VRHPSGLFSLLALLFVAAGACSPGVSGRDTVDAAVTTPQPDAPVAPPGCTEGTTRCDGTTFQRCTGGSYAQVAVCPTLCDNSLGCVVCQPNTGTCNGDTSTACKPDGTGMEDVVCDPVQGMTCNAATGLCDGPCAPVNLGMSYIGCEYFPTVTGNEVANEFDYAVAVSNTSSTPAMVTIEVGALTMPVNFTVAPNSLVVQNLPWVPELKLGTCSESQVLSTGCFPSSNGGIVAGGAYHLRATQPVTVYQFNALEYMLNGDFSYTNDASLLLPTNVLTGNYYVASYPGADDMMGDLIPGELAITASQDGTVVMLKSASLTIAGAGVPAFIPGVPQMVMLNQGDVLEVITSGTGDLTGSLVAASKPVQVIGAHYCTTIPNGVAACDHLEESMFPIEALSSKYIVTSPSLPSIPSGKVETIRIIATEAGTTLTYDPPQFFAPTSIAQAGGFVEIAENFDSFEITSNHKVLVAQYMEGQDAGGDSGDPAMTVAVGLEQYRENYLFHAPVTYVTNYVNVTAPTGAHIMLDNAPLAAATAIGSSGYGVVRAQLSQTGTHTISGDMPFGISVYGYGDYTSYWYPGGSDVAEIVISKPVTPGRP
jgi:hypothetical protein